MSIEVVRAELVTSLALVDPFGGDETAIVQLSSWREFHLLPKAADERWILGAGISEPVVISSDITVVRVAHSGAGISHRLRVDPVANGTATLTCAWLGQELVVDVEVTGL
jgi:hypothetical protein